MKLILALLLTSASFVHAKTEVACESRTEFGHAYKPIINDGDRINLRIKELENQGNKVTVTNLSTSAAIGGAGGYTTTIDKVCAVLSY